MRNLKKFMAVALAATMVLGSTSIAFAADDEGTGTGTGSLEGTVSTDVWQVVVPTDAGTAFNFTLDPEGLIAKTNEAKYGGNDIYQDDATVFFGNADADGNVVSYSNVSDAVTLVNKGTQLAKVTLSAEMSGLDVDTDNTADITMATADTFADDTVSLYLALVDANDTATPITGDSTDPTTATAVIGAAPEGAYEYKYDADGQAYEFALVDDLTGITFEEYSFKLTGACNTAADWSALAAAAPVVTVTWTVEAYEPQGTAATFTTGDAVGTINYTEGENDLGLKSIVKIEMNIPQEPYTAYDGYNAYDPLWAKATTDAGVITFDTNYINAYSANETTEATVTYINNIGQTVTTTVTVKTSDATN